MNDTEKKQYDVINGQVRSNKVHYTKYAVLRVKESTIYYGNTTLSGGSTVNLKRIFMQRRHSESVRVGSTFV